MENLIILILIAVVVLFIINLNTVEQFEDGSKLKTSSNPTINNSLDSIIDSALSNEKKDLSCG